MRHAKPYRKLSRQRSHYRALLRNLALALFQHGRIQTTLTKAKEVRRFIDRLITLGKKGTLHNRRLALALLGPQKAMVHKVFTELAERYKSRKGGYTRIIPLKRRSGDAAPLVIFELVDHVTVKKEKTKKVDDKEKTASAA